MARYIDADKLTYSRVRIIHSDGTMGGWNAVVMSSVINNAPAADVVSKGVYEQVQWERDMAMQQLEEHGIPFCGKADDVVEVVHGEWIAKDCIVRSPFARNYYCSVCKYEPLEAKNYCPTCGARMDGERKEQT